MLDDVRHAGPAPAPAPRGVATAALLLIAVAVACIGYLHPAIPMDPVRRTISDYQHTALGAVLLPIGLLAFAGALALLARALRAAGFADRRIGTLLAVAVLGLVLIATFHDEPRGGHADLADLIHKSGGIMLFGSLPLAGWVLVRRTRTDPAWARLATPMSRLATAAAVAFGLLLVGYLPGYGITLPAGGLLSSVRGLTERLVLLPEVTLALLVAVRLVLTPRRPAVAPVSTPARVTALPTDATQPSPAAAPAA